MTLIATQKNNQANIGDDDFFKVFFTDDKEIPSTYISTKDESETLKQLIERYFYCGVHWLSPELAAFRKSKKDEFEVIYSAYMPLVSDVNKSGIFISDQELEENEIEIDPYYEELLSKKSRGF